MKEKNVWNIKVMRDIKMNKLLALLLLSPLAYSDMNYVCGVVITTDGLQVEQQIKERGCQAGNILNIYVKSQSTMKVDGFNRGADTSDILTYVSSQWCNTSANIILTTDTLGITRSLSCTLYSDKPRISKRRLR